MKSTISLFVILLIKCTFSLGHVHHHHEQRCDHEDHFVTIPTPSGKILGSTLTTRLNKPFYAFRGIRYATAGRFEPPVATPKWDNVYNATQDGPFCPQPVVELVAEDCLFLNVYTKKLPERTHPKLPVIVHIHGGGFYIGGSHSAFAGPQYFMDRDIVLVTLNYRVGSLGFISTGTPEAPGNNGLKDQVVALKWIKENIAAFGGDSESITLYGYSAGAWSISMFMVSPMTKGQGLYHKAILGSGSIVGQWPVPRHQLHLAQKQARFVGCPDDTPENIIKCLKTKPALEIANTLPLFAEFGTDPILIWSPVIEENCGQERFLVENPLDLYEKGEFEKIPIMAGITQDEISDRVIQFQNNATLLEMFNNQFQKYAPISFFYERDTEKSKEISRGIKKFYFNDGPLNNESIPSLKKAYGDSIGFQIYRAVNLISQSNPQPVFYYKFAYQGRFSHVYVPNTNTPFGVQHHDDQIYLFYISLLFPRFNETDPESKMVDKLTTIYSNFAKTGNPIPTRTSKLGNIIWPPYNQRTRKYVNIGDKIVVKENMFLDRYELWDSVLQ